MQIRMLHAHKYSTCSKTFPSVKAPLWIMAEFPIKRRKIMPIRAKLDHSPFNTKANKGHGLGGHSVWLSKQWGPPKQFASCPPKLQRRLHAKKAHTHLATKSFNRQPAPVLPVTTVVGKQGKPSYGVSFLWAPPFFDGFNGKPMRRENHRFGGPRLKGKKQPCKFQR